MKFLNEFRAGFIYGKGLKCLKKNNYASAAAFFEKACSINPEYRKKGYATYYLGLCYYKLGDKRKAKEEMSIAFNVLHKKVVNEKNQRDIEYFNALSNAWIDCGALRTYRHFPNTGSRKSWAAGDAAARGVWLALTAMKVGVFCII